MAKVKEYLDIEGLEEIINYLNLQIELCKNSIATAQKAGIIKPGIGLTVADDGTLSITDTYTDNMLEKMSDAEQRASQSAIVAGNYAAQAIQARNETIGKIWSGSMEEYNNLETINPSGIYIILHE